LSLQWSTSSCCRVLRVALLSRRRPRPLCSCVLFSSYRDHRDLHSFPTRRSSDLAVQVHRALPVEEGGAASAGRRRSWGRPRRRTDRKSTRLNSSHEWTSYAVFCLKKKK